MMPSNKLVERETISKDFSKQSLEKSSFIECLFKSCNFSETNIKSARFSSCTFIHCVFSLPILDGSRLQDVLFIDCKITGADFFKCDQTFLSLSFKNCKLQYCNFSDLPMKSTCFEGSQITESHFTNTNLKEANFRNTELNQTTFHNCDLSKTDFSNSAHYTIDPRTNIITKAKFSLPEAVALLKALDIIIL